MRKHIIRATVAAAIAAAVGVGAASSAGALHREEVMEPVPGRGSAWCDFTPADAPTQGGSFSNCE